MYLSIKRRSKVDFTGWNFDVVKLFPRISWKIRKFQFHKLNVDLRLLRQDG